MCRAVPPSRHPGASEVGQEHAAPLDRGERGDERLAPRLPGAHVGVARRAAHGELAEPRVDLGDLPAQPVGDDGASESRRQTAASQLRSRGAAMDETTRAKVEALLGSEDNRRVYYDF